MLKLLGLILPIITYICSAWQKIRQKQEIKAELTEEQKDADTKAVAAAAKVRANADNSKFLLSPDERND